MTDIDLAQSSAHVVAFTLDNGRKISCAPLPVDIVEVLVDGKSVAAHVFPNKAEAALAVQEAKRTLRTTPGFIPSIGGRRDA